MQESGGRVFLDSGWSPIRRTDRRDNQLRDLAAVWLWRSRNAHCSGLEVAEVRRDQCDGVVAPRETKEDGNVTRVLVRWRVVIHADRIPVF